MCSFLRKTLAITSPPLAPGSILLITVEAEKRLSAEDFDDLSREQKEARLLEYYRAEFGSLMAEGISPSQLTENDLPILLSKIVRSQMWKSLTSRPGLRFHQLFNFVYADGARMLSIGGIVDKEIAEKKLSRGGIFKLKHVRRGEDPETISVPPLTIREKGWIDSTLMSGGRIRKRKLGLDDRLLKNYAKFYKYYPTYYEALV